uniref:Uncharacterized protein n=1 Tax=Opuntia streptacantha TaxID=393608 RepID=A0A7C8YRP6_OPUST
MSPAAGPDRAPVMIPAGVLTPAQKDQVIEWYRGEFAAANAIIDALCHHVVQLAGGGDDGASPVPSGYEAAFAAIHRRRLNWIPVLQMQKYFTIAEVSQELRKAAAKKREKTPDVEQKREKMGDGNGACVSEGEDSPDSEITDTGSHEVQANLDHTEICDNHEDCSARREQIKITKGKRCERSQNVRGHIHWFRAL